MGFLDKLFGSKKPAKPEAISVTTEKGAVYAPVAGKVEAMENIPDPVFASGAMGPCVGIWPVDGNVYAPVSGTVTANMPHAFGFLGDDGVEVLIHVGVDTVNMKGDGFTGFVKQGDHVAAGEPLMTFDIAKIKKAGYATDVITVITNTDEFKSVEPAAPAEVAAGAKIFDVVPA